MNGSSGVGGVENAASVGVWSATAIDFQAAGPISVPAEVVKEGSVGCVTGEYELAGRWGRVTRPGAKAWSSAPLKRELTSSL